MLATDERYAVDPESYKLASYFLADAEVTEKKRRELAQVIQDAIEDWLKANDL